MSASLLYVNASEADLPAIVEIYNSTVKSRMVTADMLPVPVESKQHWFDIHSTGRRPLWIIKEENEDGIIGWISFQDFYGRPAYDGTAEISIYLHENARGRGIGRQALEYAFMQCGRLHIHTLLGFIFAHNEPSIKLFLSLGFKLWGCMEDVAVMDGKKYSLNFFGKKIYQ